jgi:ankyrin repeat protein
VLFCLPDDVDDAVAVARLLLARGADPRARNGKDDTPADAARKRGLDEAAAVLG